MLCNICPRGCNISRDFSPDAKTVGGFCRMPDIPVLARAGVHLWEEPVISGTRGSGTIFFSGCNLRCDYCQNRDISIGGFGKPVSVERLKEIMRELEAKGVHNINLVTPSHYINAVCEALSEKPSVPVVFNSGGYDSIDSLKRLEGKIQIYLPDLKYGDNELGKKYSHAPDYFAVATDAIREMYRQTGDYIIDDDGIMKSGVIIRHLILPGYPKNTRQVIDWVKDNFRPGSILFSLMSQYTPVCGCPPELSKRLSAKEYNDAEDYLCSSGIEDGFMQELSSAKEEYIPNFDLTGV